MVSFWVGGTGGKFFEGLVKGQNSPKVLYESHLGFGLVQNHNESDSFERTWMSATPLPSLSL